MRDYTHFDKYLNNIYSDIYEQPPDEGHTEFAKVAIESLQSNADSSLKLGSRNRLLPHPGTKKCKFL